MIYSYSITKRQVLKMRAKIVFGVNGLMENVVKDVEVIKDFIGYKGT